MDIDLRTFAAQANSSSVNRLLAASQLLKEIPQEKMAKVAKLKLNWEIVDDDYLPTIDVEFFQ